LLYQVSAGEDGYDDENDSDDGEDDDSIVDSEDIETLSEVSVESEPVTVVDKKKK
jgi:hypothetical protein